MTIEVEVQTVTACTPLPDEQQFALWARLALQGREEAELTIRLVDKEESRQLNFQYRGIEKATNVLSFPADLPAEVAIPLLGDVVICAPIVLEEAATQNKDVQSNWAHITIHGVLHLLGLDHQEDAEAAEMEALEVSLLGSLGISNPYK